MAYYRTGTNDFSSIQYTNLEANNIKNGITVTVKDPNDITLKSVTGSLLYIPEKTIFISGRNLNFQNPAVTLGTYWKGGVNTPIVYESNGTFSEGHYAAYLTNPINMTGKNHIYISGTMVNRWICEAHIQNTTSFGSHSGRYANLSDLTVVNVSDLNGNYYIGFTASSWRTNDTNYCSNISIDHIYYD